MTWVVALELTWRKERSDTYMLFSDLTHFSYVFAHIHIYTHLHTCTNTHTFKINGHYFNNLFQNEKKSIEDSLCLTFFWIWVVILAFVLYLASSCLSHFNTSRVLFCSYESWSCSNIPTLLLNFITVSHALHICIDEYLTTIYFLTFRWIWHCCWSWIYLSMELREGVQ